MRGFGVGFALGVAIGVAIALYFGVAYLQKPIDAIPPRGETLELGVWIAFIAGFPASILFFPISSLGFPVGWLLFMAFAPSANLAVIGAIIAVIRDWYQRRRQSVIGGTATGQNEGAA